MDNAGDKPTLLLTGATGFIGRAVLGQLGDQGFSVRAALRSAASAARLARSCATAVVGEIGPETDWAAALAGVDTVIHLVSYSPAPGETEEQARADFFRVNVDGSVALARASVQAGVRRLVFISTVKVNGGSAPPTQPPYRADDVPAPDGAYGESKWEAEAALCRIAGDSGLELVVIRPPLVYGPGGGRNYLALLQAVERGLPLPFASVNNRRSMIFVENLAHVICLCATVPHAAGQIYLVSDNEDLSTPELLRRMGRALGRPVRLFPVPVPLLRLAGKLVGRQDMMERLVGSLAVDISAVKDELGWSPPYTQEQGLRATVGHYYGRDEASDG